MADPDRWPFYPRYLSDAFEPPDLEVLLSGCSDRLGRPLTVLDFDHDAGKFARNTSALENTSRRFTSFCRFLRTEGLVDGGTRACEVSDDRAAQTTLDEFRRTGTKAQVFPCHMGLMDMNYVVCYGPRPLGILFSGQFAPEEGPGSILERVRSAAEGRHADLKLNDGAAPELERRVGELAPHPAIALDALVKEGQFIEERLLEHLREQKDRREREFLDRLREDAVSVVEPVDRAKLRALMLPIIEKVREYLGCAWIVCFGSLGEGDTVLAPIGSAGVPEDAARELPHFNWRKAGLPADALPPTHPAAVETSRELGVKGIRGHDGTRFGNVSCVLPVAQDARYRAALALGPFAATPVLAQEARFLREVANIVCSFALTALEVKYLQDERERWQTTAKLIVHQLGSQLAPINIYVGWAKDLLRDAGSAADLAEARHCMGIVEELVMSLSQSASKTIAGHLGQLEPRDLHVEAYPLSVLVDNTARGFAGDAQRNNRTLIIDPSVERLPWVLVDPSRLCVAIGNLLNNAIKYSYPNTRIFMRGRLDFADALAGKHSLNAVLEIQDTGHSIPLDDREAIFEQGRRSKTATDARIPGSGLGLWEAREIVRLHGGTIRVAKCEPTGGRSHITVFEVRLPVSQGKE